MTNELHASGEFYRSLLKTQIGLCPHGLCHVCHRPLGADQRCPKCHQTHRYLVHGYLGDSHNSTPCPHHD